MSLRYTHRGDLPETLERIEAKLAELDAVLRILAWSKTGEWPDDAALNAKRPAAKDEPR